MEYDEGIASRTISLIINGRTYKFTVDKDDENRESLLRKSAKTLNSLIEQKKENVNGIINDEQDIIALALLNFVYKTISKEISMTNKIDFLENSILEIKNLNFKLEEIIESFNELINKE